MTTQYAVAENFIQETSLVLPEDLETLKYVFVHFFTKDLIKSEIFRTNFKEIRTSASKIKIFLILVLETLGHQLKYDCSWKTGKWP